MLRRAATRVGGWTPGVKREAANRFRNKKTGRFMSKNQVARRGYGAMGGTAAGYVGLNRKASGSQGAPPVHSSGGHMLY